MKINETALQRIVRSYSPKVGSGTAAGQKASPAAGSDEISLSADAQGLQRMMRAAQAASGVRGERVAEIRSQINSGGYVLDPAKIANRMLGLSGGD